MKRISLCAILSVLLFAITFQAQGPASKPGPEHKRLEIWAGEWATETELKPPLVTSASKSIGKVSARWVLGGYFMEIRGEDRRSSGTFQWQDIYGYDPAIKRYTAYHFDSYGDRSVASFTIDNTRVNVSGTAIHEGKEEKKRNTIVFGPDFSSYTEKFEISQDGKTWITLLETKGKKVKSTPK